VDRVRYSPLRASAGEFEMNDKWLNAIISPLLNRAFVVRVDCCRVDCKRRLCFLIEVHESRAFQDPRVKGNCMGKTPEG